MFSSVNLSAKITTVPINKLTYVHFDGFYFKGDRTPFVDRLPIMWDLQLIWNIKKDLKGSIYLHNILSDRIKYKGLDSYHSLKPGYYVSLDYELNESLSIYGGYGLTKAITAGGSQLHYKYFQRLIFWLGLQMKLGKFQPYISFIADDRNESLEEVLVNSKLRGQRFFLIGGIAYSL